MSQPRAPMAIYRTEAACRACGGGALVELLPFGPSPLADRLLRADQLAEPDVAVPLTLVFCPARPDFSHLRDADGLGRPDSAIARSGGL